MKKLTPEVYQKEFLGIVVQLWAMTDRTVRTTLLSSLKNMADFIPNSAINKQIFDNVLAGFTDSNAKYVLGFRIYIRSLIFLFYLDFAKQL